MFPELNSSRSKWEARSGLGTFSILVPENGYTVVFNKCLLNKHRVEQQWKIQGSTGPAGPTEAYDFGVLSPRLTSLNSRFLWLALVEVWGGGWLVTGEPAQLTRLRLLEAQTALLSLLLPEGLP